MGFYCRSVYVKHGVNLVTICQVFFFNLLNSNTNFILLLWKMQYF